MAAGTMTHATHPMATPARVPRISPIALEQRMRRLLRPAGSRPGTLTHPIVLVRAEPVWDGEPEFQVDGKDVRVVPCVSPLAVLEQVTARSETPRGHVLVLLTDREEGELGDGVLSHVHRHRVHVVEPWALVEESFGAARLDPRLAGEKWAAQALLDAMPPGGWPRLPGAVLSRDTALSQLAARRLGLDRIGRGADGIDVPTLLRWSYLPGAAEALRALRAEERHGLLGWLTGRTGRAAHPLFALVDAGRGTDALPLGLVCACLWGAGAPAGAERAQGRVETYFGDGRPDAVQLDDAALRAFATVAHDVVVGMLAAATNGVTGSDEDGEQVHTVLDRAEELLLQFGAQDAGRVSDVLRSGFEHRVGVVAAALRTCLADHSPERMAAAAAAVADLRRHHLAGIRHHRVGQTMMAQRLVQWLGAAGEQPESVGAGVDAHLADWGWVDVALQHIWTGEDVHPELSAAYRAVYMAAAERRHVLDETFAHRLAAWTSAGAPPGEALCVETVLERIIAPLLRTDGARALLVVLDGMSAAVAVELAQNLRRERWQEYDPLGGRPAGPARRRAAIAALPTVTTVSRASLLSGRLTAGGQTDEKAAFEHHRLWRGRSVRLFHRGSLHGGPGVRLATDLTEALGGDDAVVAVVINTVDDSLDAGHEGFDIAWTMSDIWALRAVLDHARAVGRAVVITSDHGHVPEHGGRMTAAPDALSARHRSGEGPVADGEVELTGPRVMTSDNRIIALWDPRLRYTARKAGYHGGASPAEVTVPVLAFLPFAPSGKGTVPRGWRALADQRPDWWSLERNLTNVPPAQAAPPVVEHQPRRPRRRPPVHEGQAAFDLPAPEPEPVATEPVPARTGAQTLVEALLATEMFRAQAELTPRKVPAKKIAAALAALLDANGTLATAVVAERAAEHPSRAVGFATTLQRIFNVDNYPVLSLIDDSRTVRLDVVLLREQFGIPGGLR